MIYLAIFIIEIIFLFSLSKNLKSKLFRFFLKITKSKKWTVILYSLVFLPGTFIHEASHFLVSLFLLVSVGQINLIPKLEGEKLELGSVPTAKTDIIRGTLIGIAPLIFGVASIFFLVSYFGEINAWWVKVIFGYLIFQIGNSMFLSFSDAKDAIILFFVLLLFFGIFYFLGLRVSVDSASFLPKLLTDLLEKTVKFMLIPIGIDLAMLLPIYLAKL